MKNSNDLFYAEVEILALKMCGKSDDEVEQLFGTGIVNDLLLSRYEITYDSFYEVVNDLLPFAVRCNDPFSNTEYSSFIDHGNGVPIVEKPIDE